MHPVPMLYLSAFDFDLGFDRPRKHISGSEYWVVPQRDTVYTLKYTTRVPT
jgi:hypothetical protein